MNEVRDEKRSKTINMFIIVGACDVPYSQSLNWNSYFNYYVIHDFMKFELVHFVFASCLFSCLKSDRTSSIEKRPRTRTKTRASDLVGAIFFSFFFLAPLPFIACVALISFHNQLSEYVSAQTLECLCSSTSTLLLRGKLLKPRIEIIIYF